MPLTPLGIETIRCKTNFQLWAYDQLALASGQVLSTNDGTLIKR
jgi:hypothetical protein